ncbi:hypothetical protein H8D73_00650, partial [bacterium]|nr:hypothetical protein [bacterium]
MVDWAAHQDDLMSKFLKDQDREPLNSSLPHIASVVQKAASEEFDNVNLVSCALVLKDLIYIDFSPEKMREFTPWNRCAFADEGLLAGCYRTACGTEGIERITVFPNKKAFLDVPQLTQRAEFIRNPDLKSLCVAPLVIGDSSIGSINISFRSELSDAQAAKVKLWLDEAAGSLKWLFYSEHIRLNNIWDMAQGLIASLQRRS